MMKELFKKSKVKFVKWEGQGIYLYDSETGKPVFHRIYNHKFTQWVFDMIIPNFMKIILFLSLGIMSTGLVLVVMNKYVDFDSKQPIINVSNFFARFLKGSVDVSTMYILFGYFIVLGLSLTSIPIQYFVSNLDEKKSTKKSIKKASIFAVVISIYMFTWYIFTKPNIFFNAKYTIYFFLAIVLSMSVTWWILYKIIQNVFIWFNDTSSESMNKMQKVAAIFTILGVIIGWIISN
ncbi:hypothetical protein [Lactobacillus plantarum JDM1] [Lactiplantibacillus mudanjiangensis]|uniref:hypothetical protein n=1 Tax=Lactiplantibacillus mudanjiangensis TaxID=1296538 RepID=UPI0010140764|nr:hypothetical protein [Lactobacillus plantarum JDM1] [Lactiplantibacillus mudanjiangensis]